MQIDYQATKDPGETLDYTMDWSEWLRDGRVLSNSTWEIQSGLTQVAALSTSTTATVWLSGGTDGETYLVKNIVTTTGAHPLIGKRSISIAVQIR